MRAHRSGQSLVFRLIVILAVAAVMGNFTAGAFQAAIEEWRTIDGSTDRDGSVRWMYGCIAGGFASLALTVGLSWYIYTHRHALKRVHERTPAIPAAQHPYQLLIFFVSQEGRYAKEDIERGRFGDVQLTGDLDADIERISQRLRSPAEMLLRGLRPHVATLKEVWLIGSSDADGSPGSFNALPAVMLLLQRYVRKETRVLKYEKPVDFNNVSELTTALSDLLKRRTPQSAQIDDAAVGIDVTGGQKPPSIAGAAVTIGSRLTIQYVQTNPPKEVIVYDLDAYDVPW